MKIFTIFRDKFMSFLHDNGIILILLSIYILIHDYWEKLIAEHIVGKILEEHFIANWLNDIIFYIFFLVCLIIFLLNIRKHYSQKIIIICFIAIGFWAYYRWCSYRFDFIALHSIQSIKYIDIVPIYSSSILLSALINGLFPRKISFSDDNGFIKDSPFNDFKDDLYGRRELATNAIEKIISTDTNDSAFTFGINAPWGTGKTSFMNIMKEVINSSSFPNHFSYPIIIDFNPWLYSDKKDLITAFFEELSNVLKRYSHTLSKELIDYSKLLSALDLSETNFIVSLINITQDQKAIQEKKEQIVNSIRLIKKRIIVFIDDLDRLSADELLLIMKLIRNISDFPYMYFIAAYDKNYIINCLEAKMPSKGVSFVDKIFPIEIHLPPIHKISLLKLLSKSITGPTILKGYILKKNDNNPLNSLSTIREVKRLANNVNLFLSLSEDINPIDVLLFELFKMKYPSVHSFFEQEKEVILKIDDDGKHYHLNQDENDRNHINFIEYIKEHKKEYNLNDIDVRSISIIFNELFNREINDEAKTITYHRFNEKESIDRFIHISELETDITDEEFNEFINGIDLNNHYHGSGEKIIEWDWKPRSFIYHLLDSKAQNKEEQKKRISVIFYILNIYEMGIITKSIVPTFSQIDKTLTKLKDFNGDGHDDATEDRDFIINELSCHSLFLISLKDDNESFDNFLLFSYLNHLHKNIPIKDIPLNDKNITDIQYKCLDEVIILYNDKPEIVTKCFFNLIYDNNDLELKPKMVLAIDTSQYFVKKLSSRMKEYINDNIIYYIKTYIYQRDSKYGLNTLLFKIIWENLDNYVIFIEGIDDNSDACIPEYKKFLTAYKENKYVDVDFTFLHIQPKTLSFVLPQLRGVITSKNSLGS